MNDLTILLKLWPAIKDAFFGGLEFSSYIRRNKLVMMLILSNAVTFCSFFYVYEEAFMHGAISKSKTELILNLKKQVKELQAEVNKYRAKDSL